MFCDTLSSGIKQPVCSVGECSIRDCLKFDVFCAPSIEKALVLCFSRKLSDSFGAPRHVEVFLVLILEEWGPNDIPLVQEGASHYLQAAVRSVLPGSNDPTAIDW
jgi:hypothetical protein